MHRPCPGARPALGFAWPQRAWPPALVGSASAEVEEPGGHFSRRDCGFRQIGQRAGEEPQGSARHALQILRPSGMLCHSEGFQSLVAIRRIRAGETPALPARTLFLPENRLPGEIESDSPRRIASSFKTEPGRGGKSRLFSNPSSGAAGNRAFLENQARLPGKVASFWQTKVRRHGKSRCFAESPGVSRVNRVGTAGVLKYFPCQPDWYHWCPRLFPVTTGSVPLVPSSLSRVNRVGTTGALGYFP